jgi:glyoxylase-like metal-dependent hydrolase (beta-lactamase superfamily II)
VPNPGPGQLRDTGSFRHRPLHSEWTEGQPWGPEVSSYAIDDGTRLLLFDPVTAPSEIEHIAERREPVVVLTAPWHERGTHGLVERFHAPVYVAEPDGPDVTWLLGNSAYEAHLISAGEGLPFGIEAFAGRQPNDLVFWVESQRALVCGDTLVDFGRGLEIHDEWLWGGVTRDQVVDALRPLLELPVQLVLPAHGTPTDKPALVRALS